MADLPRTARCRREWRGFRAALVLLVVAAFFAVQTGAALANHPDHHGPSDHCCAACHGGHFPVVQTGAFVHTAQLTTAGWGQQLDDERPLSHGRAAVNSSRAPPA